VDGLHTSLGRYTFVVGKGGHGGSIKARIDASYHIVVSRYAHGIMVLSARLVSEVPLSTAIFERVVIRPLAFDNRGMVLSRRGELLLVCVSKSIESFLPYWRLKMGRDPIEGNNEGKDGSTSWGRERDAKTGTPG
jgi:hypothetical protein